MAPPVPFQSRPGPCGHPLFTIIRGAVVTAAAAVSVGPPRCPGDLDGSGSVGGADLAIVPAAFGSSAVPPASAGWNSSADIDGNGAEGAGGRTALLVNFGGMCP
ncbi:MAG: hypothetical protein IBJ11_05000 [Phycisphaerales bacterium]|nr:hypothetical protein [Phycisphaerales bacterium]